MKLITPLILAATSLSSFASVSFDFPNGLILDDVTGAQVGTFTLVSSGVVLTETTDIQAFQIDGTTNIAIQGQGTDFDGDPTISLTVNLTNTAFSIESFNVASTSTVSGVTPANGLGFNIGNTTGNGANPADLGLSFNVDGTFTTGNTAGGIFVFDAVNSDIQADGTLLAGQIAAADTTQSGDHLDDTFLFVSDTPVGNGDTFETTIISFDDNTISGEAFRFDLVIVPEPSSTALLGLGALALFARRKR